MFDEKFFTTDQVAKILQVHPFTILKFIKQGKLKGIKLGRVYRIMESDINNFIEAQSTQPPVKKKETKKANFQESPKNIQKAKEQKKNSIELKKEIEDQPKKDIPGKQEPDHYYII